MKVPDPSWDPAIDDENGCKLRTYLKAEQYDGPGDWKPGMKKYSNSQILIGIISVIIAIFLASLTRVYFKEMFRNDKQPDIGIIAKSINKKFNAPTMVDKETQLTSVSASNGKLSFNYIMINYTYEQLLKINFDVTQIETEVTSQICNQKDYVKLLNKGIGLEYVYSDKTGKKFGIFVIEPFFCNKKIK